MASYHERIDVLNDGSQNKGPVLGSSFHPNRKVDNDTSSPEIHIYIACIAATSTNRDISIRTEQEKIKA